MLNLLKLHKVELRRVLSNLNEILTQQNTLDQFFFENEFKENSYYSTLNFKEKVIPKIKKWLKVEAIHSIEDRKEDFCKNLDRKSGIDFYAEHYCGLIWLATRLQWDNKNTIQAHYKEPFPYDTFTIRKELVSGGKTEFEKRKIAKENNFSRPNYLIHGYLTEKTKGEILSLAMCNQDDLITYILNDGKVQERKRDNKFLTISWFDFQENYKIALFFGKNYPIWKNLIPNKFIASKERNFSFEYYNYKKTLMDIMIFINSFEKKECNLEQIMKRFVSNVSSLSNKIEFLEKIGLISYDRKNETISIKNYEENESIRSWY